MRSEWGSVRHLLLCAGLAWLPAGALAESEGGAFQLTEEERPLLEEGTRSVLPPLDASLLGGERAPEAGLVFRGVELAGSTVLTPSDVDRLVAPWRGRTLTPEDLGAIRQALSLAYAEAGYVGSGVVIPEQEVADGIVRMEAVETRITDVTVQGGRLPERYVSRRMLRALEGPMRLPEVERSVRLLQEHPLVSRVNARLVDGTRPGDTRLLLDLAPAKPYEIALGVDNYRPPSIGAEQGVLQLTHRDLTGHRDVFFVGGNYSDGFLRGAVGYEVPLNDRDTTLSLYAERGDSVVVEAPFEDIDIESTAERYRLGLSHPLVDRLDTRFSLFGNVTLGRSETTLLGTPFSFSLGAQEGESNTSTLELGTEVLHRSTNQVIAGRLSVRRGFDVLDATVLEDGMRDRDLTTGAEIPDGEFTALLAQLQYARNLPFLDSQLGVRVVWQQAFDPLLVLEKFAVGGFSTVRGYRENSLVRDSGAAARLEWQVPVFGAGRAGTPLDLRLVPFADYGWARDENDALRSGDDETLASVGLGFEWNPLRVLAVSAYYGYAFDDDALPEPAESNLQDDGLHFSLFFHWPTH